MKHIFKNKRGIAMESAILFMLVMFFFAFLLTTVVSYSHLRVKQNERILESMLTIEQIGEDFVSLNSTDFQANFVEKYEDIYIATIEVTDEENKTLSLTNKRENTVLYIKIEDGKIIRWKYTNSN